MVMTMTMMVITRGIISPMRQHHHQQQPQEVQQPKPKELAINPATTSSLMRRRGRMSPMRNMASLSRAGTVSPTKSMLSSDSRSVNSKYNGNPRGSPTRSVNSKYMYGSGSGRKKTSLSVVDNPAYYSMESRLGQIKDPI